MVDVSNRAIGNDFFAILPSPTAIPYFGAGKRPVFNHAHKLRGASASARAISAQASAQGLITYTTSRRFCQPVYEINS